ncbi:MAG: hypothetical protein M3O70_06035 [Actinomycetota bacterium]|nr:hypothetical protein [Actinomycetota bacterium]
MRSAISSIRGSITPALRKRAEQVEETRQRIIDAAVRLHTTGPASTTITRSPSRRG